MRTLFALYSVGILFLCRLPATAAAGEIVFRCHEAVVEAGQPVLATVQITNDTDRTARYRMSARVRGDRDLMGGRAKKVRGRQFRFRFRLEPGETMIRDVEMMVPHRADGPVVAELRVRGPEGRERVRHGLYASSDPETMFEASGRLRMHEDKDHPLRFETEDGKAYRLMGPEAGLLEEMMMDSGLRESHGVLRGVDLEEMPMRKPLDAGDGASPCLLLGFDLDGVEDDREGLVPYHAVMMGMLTPVTSPLNSVVRSRQEWEAMLASAGLGHLVDAADGEEGKALMGGGGSGHMSGSGHDDHDSAQHGGTHPHLMADPDFETETLLAIFAGQTDASHVRILGIMKKEDGSLVCRYRLEGMHGMQDMHTARPCLVVAIPKTDAEVEFVREK